MTLSEAKNPTCTHCGAGESDRPLQRCPICFKWFCDEHGHDMSGRAFCSSHCAEYFFFADPDDQDD